MSNDSFSICACDDDYGKVIVNGYELIAYSENTNAINAGKEGVIIGGGQVSANGSDGKYGIYSDGGSIILGCTACSDFITASAYSGASGVYVADGQALMDEENNIYSGSITDYSVIAGKMLSPVSTVVSFEAGEDGSGSMDPVAVPSGTDYYLPTADAFTAPEGMVLQKWLVKIGDAEAESKQPGDSVTVTAFTTVTAVWQPVDYTITILDTAGGSIEAKVGETQNAVTAQMGDTVALTIVPPAGYTLSSLTVSYGENQSIQPVQGTDDNSDKWLFTMPAANVAVAAVFAVNKYGLGGTLVFGQRNWGDALNGGHFCGKDLCGKMYPRETNPKNLY